MAQSVYLGSVYATLDLKTDGFKQSIQQAEGSMGGLKNTILGVFGGNLLYDGVQKASQALINFGKESLDTGSNFQQMRIGFETMLGSADAAAKMLRNISDFAAKTPFELPDVVEGTRRLLAMGFAADEVIPSFRDIGNAVAGLGGGKEVLNQVIKAFGQMKAKGTVAREELMQLAGAGIPAMELLAKGLGMTGAQLDEAITKKSITADQAIQVLRKGMSEKFPNLMEKQAQTFGGTVSNLSDSMTRFRLALIGVSETGEVVKGGLFDKIQSAAKGLLSFLNDNASTIQTVLAGIGTTIISAFGLVSDAIKLLTSNMPALFGALIGLAVFFGPALIAGIVGAATAMWAFAAGVWAAIAPILPFIAIGAAIGFAIDFIVKKTIGWNGVLDALKAAWNGLVSFFQGVVMPIFDGIKNAIALLVTGDFKGGIFGLQEDSPFIAALFTARDILLKIWDIVVKNLGAAWDSIKTSMATAWDTLKTVAMPIVQQLADLWNNTLYPAIQPLLPLLGTIGKVIAIAFGVAVFGPIVVAIGLVVGAFIALSYVIKFLAPIVGFLIEIFATLVGFIINVVVGTFKFLWAVVSTTIQVFITVFTGIYNVVTTVLTAVWAFITTIFTIIYNVISAYVQAWWRVVSFVTALLLAVVITVFQAIWAVISAVMGAIWNVITSVWNAIYNTLAPIVLAIWNFIVTAFNTIRDTINAVLTAVKTKVTEIWNSVYNFLKGVVDGIVNFLAQRWENLKNNVTNAFNAVLNTARNIWNQVASAISGPVNNIINAVLGMKDRVFSAISGIGGWLVNAGRDLIQGFINGVTSMGSNLVNSMTNFIKSKVPEPIRHALGIKSPSKLMEQFGKYTVQGFALGIDRNASMVSAAVAGVMDNLTNADFSGALSPQLSVGGVGSTGTVSQPITTNIYGNISIASEVDADNFLAKLTRNQELAQKGLTPR